jgi:GT2 family glycosyltransferase
MKKISIVIVTYNSISLIKECIDSIFDHNDLPDDKIEVLVVDNSDVTTSKELFDFIKNLYGDTVILIKNEANLGYGHGNNMGVNAATGDIICIMNPDVRFIEPLLQTVQNNFETDSNLGLLGFKQLGGKNLSFYLKPESNYGIFNSLIIKATNALNLFNPNQFYLSGAFLFLDKSKFIAVGAFDENIFMHLEEPDISNRILKNSYSIRYLKQFKYIHLVGDRKTVSDFTIKAQTASLNYYLEKYKIDKKWFCDKMEIEYKIKIALAHLISDKQRVMNFKKEFKNIKEILKQ